MSCRNLSYKLDELRHCGCRRCEEDYYHMRDGYERDYRTRNYYDYSRAIEPPRVSLPVILPAEVPKEPKMEEPKNIAIKILVEKLKAEQNNLVTNETVLKSHETHAKAYREKKNKNQRDIKELAAALKKLGHKEV